MDQNPTRSLFADLSEAPQEAEVGERMEELSRLLNTYNELYYRQSISLVSDSEYDAFVCELKALEQRYPELRVSNSPTRQVGDDRVEGFAKVRHRVPMLSLENTYSLEDLEAFGERLRAGLGALPELVCELKYDGVAVSVLYRKGELVRAATRGNGEEGDDVTSNVLTIQSLPYTLRGENIPEEIEFRGEIYLPRDQFDRLNAERLAAGKEAFVTPRNTASGALKLHDRGEVARRGLACSIYYVVGPSPLASTHMESLAIAKGWGLPVSERVARCGSIEEVNAQIAAWRDLRSELPFDTDGVVVKVNDYASQQALGLTSSSPRWAIAYKYPSLPVATRLLDVHFQVGRTGVVAPVALLDRVLIGGVYVQRATLHNADQLARLDLHYGDTVLVERGGEVIPKVVAVEVAKRQLGAKRVEYPPHCPACGAALRRDEGEAHTYCPNRSDCPAQIVASLVHFASRDALSIDGFGEEAAQRLFASGLVNSIDELYTLTLDSMQRVPQYRSIVLNKKGSIREKESAKKLLEAIGASKGASLSRVLFGLGIRNVGANTARTLALHFGEMDRLMASSYEELSALRDVGPAAAESVVAYFSDAANVRRIERLRALGFSMREEVEVLSTALHGKRIVISGRVPGFSREAMHELVRKHGGVVQSSVSGNTDYLVAGEKLAESKRRGAEKLGVPIIGADQLFDMINGDGHGHT